MESHLQNLAYGDADSEGWRQERKRFYKNPRNVRASVRRFFDEAAKADHGQSSYQLAQDVQRSARPDRYRQVAGQAGSILRSTNTSGSATNGGTRTIPGTDRSGDRQALLRNYLATSHSPDALLGLAQGLKGAQDTPSRTVTTKDGDEKLVGRIEKFVSRANRVDAASPPYQWGGGHGPHPAKLGVPVDCSGAVAQILRIKPRTSGQFGEVLKPGKGRVNVYYSNHHVLMEINGKFYGTSASNRGGGAGWIPRSQIDGGYLKGFKVGHVL